MSQKQLVILGAGESGVGAAILGKQKQYNVFVSDLGPIKEEYKLELIENGIEFEEENHNEAQILSADLVVKSPGIPDTAPLIEKLINNNIEVISEIEFAYRFSEEANIIAITGSNGKTTTSSLIHFMLENGGLNAALVGNIGKSFARQIAEKPVDHYVIEVSSFQLDGISTFKPHISVLLNITPDHLDRYNYNFNNYIDSKFRIAMNQDENDYFIYCLDDEAISENLISKNIKAEKIPFSIDQEIEYGANYKNESININLKKKLLTWH